MKKALALLGMFFFSDGSSNTGGESGLGNDNAL